MEKYPDFEPYVYTKKVFQSVKEEEVWAIDEKMAKYPEEERNLFKVTGEFYDENIVSRWSEDWLAGDDIWVIAFTDDTPYEVHYRPGLLARSIHILADYYREKG